MGSRGGGLFRSGGGSLLRPGGGGVCLFRASRTRLFGFRGFGSGFRKHHAHVATFDAGGLFNGSHVFEHVNHLVQNFPANILVRHFSATKQNGHFYFVAVFQKATGLVAFCLQIVVINFRTQPYLFNSYNFLALAGFLFLFALLVPVFTIIHNPADRGLGVGSHLNQVNILAAGQGQSITGFHNAKLFAGVVNNPYFRDTDAFINAKVLADSGTPFKKSIIYSVLAPFFSERSCNAGFIQFKVI